MDLARYEAMDAQRFDRMRPKKALPDFPVISTEEDMGQLLRRLSQPELPSSDVVGGIWSDHELVLVPLDVSSHRDSFSSVLAESVASTSTSESAASVSSSTTSSTYFTTPSPSAESGQETLPSTSSPETRQVDTFDRSEDLIITRTIIRPVTQPSIRGMFSWPSSPRSGSRPTSPFSRPNTPAFRALNCFRPSAFEWEFDDVQKDRDMAEPQQFLHVIVTQTREQYEQDLAFKEVVQEVYPEACGRRQAVP